MNLRFGMLFALASWMCTAQAQESITKQVPVPLKAHESARAQLKMEGIWLPPKSRAIIRVFANLPEATHASDIGSPQYLGFFAINGNSAATSAERKMTYTLDVSRKLLPLLKTAKGEIYITFVPVTGRGEKADVDLRVEKVAIALPQSSKSK